MSNVKNHGVVTGRLAADPKVFINADGSRNVMITLMADRRLLSRETGELNRDTG